MTRCPRCEKYLAELYVRRTDTDDVKRLCASCARLLVEDFEQVRYAMELTNEERWEHEERAHV